MSRIFEVVTPEQVAIRYELAGFGSRCLATFVDYLVQLGIFLVILLGYYFFWSGSGTAAGGKQNFWESMNHSIVIGIMVLVVFLVTWGYYIAFETLWNGATPGKRMMGLRVIKDGGHPVDFRAALIRNLLRAVDVLPGVPLLPIYGFGFVAVLCSNQYKRLGDMAAGTLVVRHGRDSDPRRPAGFGAAEVYRLLDATVLSQLARLSRDEYRMVQRFLERRNKLPQTLRVEFARRLALPLMEKFAYRIAGRRGLRTLAGRTGSRLSHPCVRRIHPSAGCFGSAVAQPTAPIDIPVEPADELRKW